MTSNTLENVSGACNIEVVDIYKSALKSECPVAAGQVAEQKSTTQSIPPAYFLGNSENAFATLEVQFALTGHALLRFREATCIESYSAEHLAIVRSLPIQNDAPRLLAQIGQNHGI